MYRNTCNTELTKLIISTVTHETERLSFFEHEALSEWEIVLRCNKQLATEWERRVRNALGSLPQPSNDLMEYLVSDWLMFTRCWYKYPGFYKMVVEAYTEYQLQVVRENCENLG